MQACVAGQAGRQGKGEGRGCRRKLIIRGAQMMPSKPRVRNRGTHFTSLAPPPPLSAPQAAAGASYSCHGAVPAPLRPPGTHLTRPVPSFNSPSPNRPQPALSAACFSLVPIPGIHPTLTSLPYSPPPPLSLPLTGRNRRFQLLGWLVPLLGIPLMFFLYMKETYKTDDLIEELRKVSAEH